MKWFKRLFKKVKLEPFHLIDNFEDGKDFMGMGFVFHYKGELVKVAIRIENDFTPEELKKAWRKLMKAVDKPEAPDSGVVFGNGRLSGKEIVVR